MINDTSIRTRKRPAQKASLIIAYISYLVAVIMLGLALYYGATIGTENPIFASFAASVVFFIGAGVVLHVIGAVNLPNLKIDNDI